MLDPLGDLRRDTAVGERRDDAERDRAAALERRRERVDRHAAAVVRLGEAGGLELVLGDDPE